MLPRSTREQAARKCRVRSAFERTSNRPEGAEVRRKASRTLPDLRLSALAHKYANVFQAHLRQLAAAFIARSLLRAHSLGAASCSEANRKQVAALQIRYGIHGMVH